MSNRMMYAVLAIVLIGAVGLLVVPHNIFASAKSTGAPVDQDTVEKNVEVREPCYACSIKVPENQSDNETQEDSMLASLAKITPQQAEQAALANVSGKVVKISLDNENGCLVYSVEIKTNAGIVEVKVDAGNGSVLYIEKNAGIEEVHETMESER